MRTTYLRTLTVATLLLVGLNVVAQDQHLASGFGVNKDSLTMQECRERLALPAKQRPKSEDPTINKDAICANMLSGSTSTKKPSAPSRALAPPGRAAST